MTSRKSHLVLVDRLRAAGAHLIDDEPIELALPMDDAQIPHKTLSSKRLGRDVEQPSLGMT